MQKFNITGFVSSESDKNNYKDTLLIMPRLYCVELKDNHISILDPIKGDVGIYLLSDKGEVKDEIKLRDYNGKNLFMTLPKEWIGKNILIKYTRYFV